MRKIHKQRCFTSSRPSLTRPDLAYTIREISDRFVKGKSLPPMKNAIPEPYGDKKVNPMRRPYTDLVDMSNYTDDLTAQLNKSEELLTQKKQELNKAVYEKMKKKEDV